MAKFIPSRVGQYNVNVSDFDRLALPAMKKGREGGGGVLVIDEIGKMELFSSPFVQSVRKCFDSCKCRILCTVPMAKSEGGRGLSAPLLEAIRARDDKMLVTVTRENRDELVQNIVRDLSS